MPAHIDSAHAGPAPAARGDASTSGVDIQHRDISQYRRRSRQARQRRRRAALCRVVGFVGAMFILVPAVGSYGRVWEKVAAGFLTLFMLVTLVGVGTAIGLAIVWSYDRYA
jgi:hypothetical protein